MHAAWLEQASRTVAGGDSPKTLLLLPGSRRSEVNGLIGVFRDAVERLSARGHRLRLVLPTVPHVADLVTASVADWPNRPEVVIGSEAKWRAFAEADAALAASGTVTLELALAGVPLLSCYRLDWITGYVVPRIIAAWSASLPNLIADTPLVSECYAPFLKPDIVAHHIEPLLLPTALREWQRNGFRQIRETMTTDRPSGQIAADVVAGMIETKRL